jgi:hypothetical protein
LEVRRCKLGGEEVQRWRLGTATVQFKGATMQLKGGTMEVERCNV